MKVPVYYNLDSGRSKLLCRGPEAPRRALSQALTYRQAGQIEDLVTGAGEENSGRRGVDAISDLRFEI